MLAREGRAWLGRQSCPKEPLFLEEILQREGETQIPGPPAALETLILDLTINPHLQLLSLISQRLLQHLPNTCTQIFPTSKPNKLPPTKMKTFILATLSGLVAVVLAAAVPEVEVAALDKKADSTIYITLCNDFHGGKPCQKKPITLGKCSMCLHTLEQAPGSPPPPTFIGTC